EPVPSGAKELVSRSMDGAARQLVLRLLPGSCHRYLCRDQPVRLAGPLVGEPPLDHRNLCCCARIGGAFVPRCGTADGASHPFVERPSGCTRDPCASRFVVDSVPCWPSK